MPEAIAICNNEVAFLAWRYESKIENCLGFGIYRTNLNDRQANPIILPAWVGFRGEDNRRWAARRTTEWPIQKFDKNGNFLSKWGSSGSGNGDFNRPTGIEFSATNGIVYITDNDNKRIQVFDKNGNFLSKWGSDKNFERPTGIAVDEINKIAYVNDKANNNIQVFSISEDPFTNLNYTESSEGDSSQQSFSDTDDNDKEKSSDQDKQNSNHKGSSSDDDGNSGSGRCKDGYHKDESGDCERARD